MGKSWEMKTEMINSLYLDKRNVILNSIISHHLGDYNQILFKTVNHEILIIFYFEVYFFFLVLSQPVY